MKSRCWDVTVDWQKRFSDIGLSCVTKATNVVGLPHICSVKILTVCCADDAPVNHPKKLT